MKALDLIGSGEAALVVMTDGRNLLLRPGSVAESYTAWWKIAANRTFDRVIIYETQAGTVGADVSVGDYAGRHYDPDRRRTKVFLDNVRAVGSTDLPWHEFVGAKAGARNPIKYVSKHEDQDRTVHSGRHTRAEIDAELQRARELRALTAGHPISDEELEDAINDGRL